jgi:hypothetical protein
MSYWPVEVISLVAAVLVSLLLRRERRAETDRTLRPDTWRLIEREWSKR